MKVSNEEKELEQALEVWCKTMSCGRPEEIVKLFDLESILLPTLAPDMLKTPLEKLTYFSQLMQNANLTVTVQESNLRIIRPIAINSGLYSFSFERQGKLVVLPARFTFIYQKKPQGWVIIEQHSSQVPAPL